VANVAKNGWLPPASLVCNLCSITKSQTAIIEYTRAMRDSTGNLSPMPGVFPDYMVVADIREPCMMRWGTSSSSKAQLDIATKRADKLRAKGKAVNFKELLRMEPDSGVTDIRNASSKHWSGAHQVKHAAKPTLEGDRQAA